jgi:hypothetical protein
MGDQRVRQKGEEMKKHFVWWGGIALLFLVIAILGSSARADEWNKKTVVTFSEPVQIPGAVLPAGTYVFKLFDSQTDRSIVEIFNADESHLFATIMAIPDYRPNPSDKTILTFAERPVGQPEAVQSWFYPGDNYGLEFVYPKQKATELAQTNKRPVPSVPDEVTEPAALKTAAVTRVASAPETPAPAPAPAASTESSTTVVAAVAELPHTASPLAPLALLSLLCLASAIALRRILATAPVK